MKSDLLRLLAERNIDLLWAVGATHDCPDVYYLTNGQPLTLAWIILRRGHEPLLVHGAMERESAARSGCRTIDFSSLGIEELSRSFSDPLALRQELFVRLAERENLSGRLTVHGVMDPGEAHALLAELPRRISGLEVVRDTPSLIQEARITKDGPEIERMKDVAARSLVAFDAALALLRSGHLEDSLLLDEHGHGITVGRVKAAISASLAAQGLQETHETILSIGREAGIPHASSEPETVFSAGKTVVFDLFPCTRGGGYYFDITRSFGIGFLPEAERKLWDCVLQAQEKAIAAIRPGLDGSRLQELVCEHFEAAGHPTVRSNPRTSEGYVHSLGHGVGLEVHEYPYLRLNDTPISRNSLLPGSVFTIEPGLYYPGYGMGVRIEDSLYLDSAGNPQFLAQYPKYPVLVPEG